MSNVNMTKKLPQLQQYRPYKYNDVRRKFRMGADPSKDIDSIKEEEFNQRILRHHLPPTTERETSNLVKSRSNLGVSRENLGASQDSLNREPKTTLNVHGSNENLRDNIQNRQTTLDECKKREENGRNVYSFSLQKADRSKSDSMIFPPLKERTGTKASQQQVLQNQYATSTSHDGLTLNKNQHQHHHHPQHDLNFSHISFNKENTNIPSDRMAKKPPTGIKFPLVTRADLYKHLGINQDGRKHKNSKKTDVPGDKITISKEEYNSRYKTQPKGIAAESGGSRQVAFSSNPYGRGPETMSKNKVEMYKQWHEEQSKQKIKRGVLAETTRDAIKLATVYREKYNISEARNKNIRLRNRDGTLPKIGIRNSMQNERIARSNAPSRADATVHATKLGNVIDDEPRPESPPACIPEELLNMRYSAKTWRTWRSVNESYSYTNVQEYIEDNELMDDEKSGWIRDWVIDVDKKFFHPPPPDSDEEEEDLSYKTSSQSGYTSSSRQEKMISEAEQSDIIIEKAEAITKL